MTYPGTAPLTAQAPGGNTDFSHDAGGNRTLAVTSSGRTTFVRDVRDRLREIQLPTGVRVTSTYRHDDLRHSRSEGAGIQTMVWDGDEVLAVEGQSAQIFIYGPDLARVFRPRIDPTYHLDVMGGVLCWRTKTRRSRRTTVRMLR